MKNVKAISIAILLALFLFGCIGATEAKGLTDTNTDPYIDMILGQVEFMEGRIISLAEAIPAEKYDWRPMEGVRSTGEQLIHVLSASYFIPSLMGGEKPEHITQDLEKTLKGKENILKELKSSFASAAKFLQLYDTANYEKMVKTPFGDYTQRVMILILNNHYHENLGQLITYARSNGVVPPWSVKQEK
jgi:uncharacterized damage-inducible protein DinB